MEIIIAIGVVVIVIILFMYMSKSGAKLLADREARIAKAGKGKAVVIGSHSVGLRGTGSGGHYQAYEFTLEVSNAYKEPYRAKCVWEVYPMGAPKVQQGMEVNVKIDAEDNEMIFPMPEGLAFSWNWTMMNKKKK
jgi:predicted nucleotidyltransferase